MERRIGKKGYADWEGKTNLSRKGMRQTMSRLLRGRP